MEMTNMDERFLTDVKRERKLTKLVNAPREAVFQAWTDPLQLRTWWGPRDFTAGEVVVQPQPGGTIRVDMRDSEGRTFPMRGVIRDIERPSRLVFTNTVIEDAGGGPPLEALNAIEFVEKSGGTEITWRWEAIDPAPNEMVADALEGLEHSNRESLSRLADLMSGP